MAVKSTTSRPNVPMTEMGKRPPQTPQELEIRLAKAIIQKNGEAFKQQYQYTNLYAEAFTHPSDITMKEDPSSPTSLSLAIRYLAQAGKWKYVDESIKAKTPITDFQLHQILDVVCEQGDSMRAMKILDNYKISLVELPFSLREAGKKGHWQLVKDILARTNHIQTTPALCDLVRDAAKAGQWIIMKNILKREDFDINSFHFHYVYLAVLKAVAQAGELEIFQLLKKSSLFLLPEYWEEIRIIALQNGHTQIANLISSPTDKKID